MSIRVTLLPFPLSDLAVQARDRAERDAWIAALKSAQKQHAVRSKREVLSPRTDFNLHEVLR